MAVFVSVTHADPSAAQKVDDSWQLAQEIGIYQYNTKLVQTTYPEPLLENVGLSSRQDHMYISGDVNVPAAMMQMQIWSAGGSILNNTDRLAYFSHLSN